LILFLFFQLEKRKNKRSLWVIRQHFATHLFLLKPHGGCGKATGQLCETHAVAEVAIFYVRFGLGAVKKTTLHHV
jgi:hypothetical protein